MSDENVIDVDYVEESKRVISGEPLFYTTTQCAEMVGVEASTIRYWSKRFEDLLDIEISNRNRQYKRSDVEKLKFIKKLAHEDGLTLQQIEDYTTSKGFDINNIEKGIVDANNPLAIQTFVSAAINEMDKKLNDFTELLLQKVNESNMKYYAAQQELNKKLQEDIAITVDEVVSEKIDSKFSELSDRVGNELKSYVDTRELEFKKRDQDMLDFLNSRMEQQREQHKRELDEQKNKSFFSKLFGK